MDFGFEMSCVYQRYQGANDMHLKCYVFPQRNEFLQKNKCIDVILSKCYGLKLIELHITCTETKLIEYNCGAFVNRQLSSHRILFP